MAGGDEINFEHLKLDCVINESVLDNSITFRGTYCGQTAVIRLDKKPFDGEQTKELINSPSLRAEKTQFNDVYYTYNITPPQGSKVNDLRAIVVVPADEKVLTKYSRNDAVFVSETPETYNKVVEPFISNMLTSQKDYNQWVYNILEHKSEVELVIFNDTDPDTGFMLLPSLKSFTNEHILALVHRRDIASLRDLNASHLPLLTNILEKGTKILREKDKTNTKQLRSYIHYHPTFYHFHVHFQWAHASDYKSSDRDNLLTTVINNIRLLGDYYQRATLTYPLAKGSALYNELANHDSIDESSCK